MYDAPSSKARRLYVVGQGYPVEVMVSVEGWVKVRDHGGELTWLPREVLADRRTVLVTAPVAEVRRAPDGQSPLEFTVQKGVTLELVEVAAGGWVKVRHRDGGSGFVQVRSVWGL
ncbi:MAG: SH3 domain-containing protein [Burkholderiales bacterium]|nr:SH3 domain-containing protein [Burkholderiales bacterium]